MKKTIFGLSFLAMGALLSLESYAQKKLNLMVKYDQEFGRYEVYSKPNFSERNFTWGPSQISLVLPSKVLVDKIRVINLDGGSWEDNSIVQAPEIASEKSFHGISTGGDKTNLVEGNETVLFYFTLPTGISPSEVRIFDNESDPKSSDKGMMGGDFRNTIVDVTGNERFNDTYQREKLVVLETKDQVNLEAKVYPNVIVDNKFKVVFSGLSKKDGEVLMILTNSMGNEIKRLKASKSAIESQEFNIPNIAQQGLIVKFITTKGAVSKKLVAEY